MDIGSLFATSIDKIIDSIGNAADKIFTSEEERKLLQNELEEIRVAYKLDAQSNVLKMEKEITSRWKIDSENIITRLIRPLTVFWSYFLFTIVLIFDGNIGSFQINQAYIPMLETVLITVTVAYFSGRTFDKYTKAKHGSVDDF